MRSAASGCEAAMLFDFLLVAVVTTVYLIYALIHPERF